MPAYSLPNYLKKVQAWKDDVKAVYRTVHSGNGADAIRETLEAIESINERLPGLAMEACYAGKLWTIEDVDAREFGEAYFSAIDKSKKKYDCICSFAKTQNAKNEC